MLSNDIDDFIGSHLFFFSSTKWKWIWFVLFYCEILDLEWRCLPIFDSSQAPIQDTVWRNIMTNKESYQNGPIWPLHLLYYISEINNNGLESTNVCGDLNIKLLQLKEIVSHIVSSRVASSWDITCVQISSLRPNLIAEEEAINYVHEIEIVITRL